jgi:hypothetical protein
MAVPPSNRLGGRPPALDLVSLAEARDKAAAARKLVTEGFDPIDIRNRTKAANRLDAVGAVEAADAEAAAKLEAKIEAKLSAQMAARFEAMRAAEPAAPAKPGRKRAPETHVYIISAQGGPQKIGIAGDVEARRRALQTASPHRLAIAFSVPHPEALRVERVAHHILADRRLSGEWFAVDPDRATAVREAIPRVEAGEDRPRAGAIGLALAAELVAPLA